MIKLHCWLCTTHQWKEKDYKCQGSFRNIRANVSVNYEPPHVHLVCGVVGKRSESSPNYVKIELELSVATRTYRHA
jgi:hypothetical protein